EAPPIQWLIEGVQVADQPGVIGGPSKSFKTSLAVDLAVSLVSATPFLGKFAVPEPVTVALFSAESGKRAIRKTADHVARARRLPGLPEGRLWIQDRLPQLSDPGDLIRLKQFLHEKQAKVCVYD